jgi:hypothetical protein
MRAQRIESSDERFGRAIAAFNAEDWPTALGLLEQLAPDDEWATRVFPYLHEVRLRLMETVQSDLAEWARLKDDDEALRLRIEALDHIGGPALSLPHDESVRGPFDADFEPHSGESDLDELTDFKSDYSDYEDSIPDGAGGRRGPAFRRSRRPGGDLTDAWSPARTETIPVLRADPPPTTSTSPIRVERTPHIGVKSDLPLRSGQEFEIEIYLDTSAPLKGEHGQRVVAASGSGVLASVFASSHFRISGDANIIFTLDAADLRTALPSVIAVVTPIDEWADGVAFIGATFFVDARPVGHVTRQIDVAGSAAPTVAPTDNLLKIPANGGPVADLTVTITADPSRDGRTFWCFVSTPHIEKYREPIKGPWNLQSTTQTLVSGFMTRFTAAGTPREQLISELKGVGRILFDASPDVFRELFWALIDAGSPLKTIAIVSAEPFIPWELMIPYRSLPAYSTRQPLGVEFAIGRWTDDRTVAPAWSLRIVDSSVIAPAYTGTLILKNAFAEANMVVDQYPGDIIRPARFANVQKGLATVGRSLIHFVCHGKDGQSGIQILRLDNNEELSSANILGIDGLGELFSTSRPVVFLNACEVGRVAPSLVGLTGFVSSFIKLGATAVIAPLWSVEDKIAHEIAVHFYQEIKNNPSQTVSEIFKKVRAKGYDPMTGRDTYVAYCFYGDPNAKIEISPPPDPVS